MDLRKMRSHLVLCGMLTLAMILSACQTVVHATDRISLGMSESEVLAAAGHPYRKTASVQNGVPTEDWVYRETTWDQGGWSWNRTVMDTAVSFQNGKVVSYGPYQERHLHDNPMRPTMNVNVTESSD
jgi:hypothetical protein